MSDPPPERVLHFNTWHQARQAAKDFSQVPRQSRGGQPILAQELNPTSRGRNYNTMLSHPQRNGEIRSIGLRNPNGINHYVVHPDGHPHLPGPPHHSMPHYHAVNSKGETLICTFGNNPNIPTSPNNLHTTGIAKTGGKLARNVLKGASKALFVAGLAISASNIANASPSERMNVIANEVSSSAGGWAGAAAGAAIGTAICPGIGTAIGSVIGGIVGTFAGDSIAPIQNEQQQQNQERGGILLSGNVDICSKLKFSLDSIDKIFVDSNGNLILSSDKNKASIHNCSVKEEDFLIALLISYRNLEISFSLDPWDPLNPDGPYYQKVFYPNVLSKTAIGQTLFDCDYMMKKMSFGLVPLPANLKSTLDHSLNNNQESFDSKDAKRYRLWIISENILLNVKMIENEGSLLQYLEFGEVKMRCCCKRLNVDPSSPSGLRDSNEDLNNSSENFFAKQFTSNYGKVAEKYPQFERLRNMSKLVALAKYLRDSGVKINEDSIISSLSKRGIKIDNFFNSGPLKVNQHEPGKEKVPRLTASKEKVEGNYRAVVTLSGGVDLSTNINCNVTDSFELPKGITKKFLASISTSNNNEEQTREIKTPDGNKALVIPLSVLSPQLPMNNILEQGELMVNNDPPISLEIASSAIRLNDGNRRAFMLLANSLSQLSLHRDAVAAFTISAMLSDTVDEYESAISLADYETTMLLSETLRMNVVCSWSNCFHIHCPSSWNEIRINGVDCTLSQIYASKPSSYIPNDTAEMLMITEIKDFPDFSLLLDAMQNKEMSSDEKQALYISLVSNFFPPDSNPIIRKMMIQRDAYRTVVIVYTIENVGGENYANYHCWLVPNPQLKINSALFLLLTCSDMHLFWMDEWARKIFEESTKYEYKEMPKQNLILHLRSQKNIPSNSQDKPSNTNNNNNDEDDEELRRVLEMSKFDY